ncbi:acyl carrier protein [Nocardia sp. CDC159]|uniref:Acyl carrier protein n=1 Tax=Nocardia pulmonis TaxID=2951408 RepID=A0A9X2E8Q0_9NOCA|nr:MULTISPECIES: acyl carrier protein [Nocardia]MCM6776369.1 acyl carrier protein [Nocardia pulmonis]MCM6788793.1 acyl carrier protein [Nocardia sp. CDC159]
MKRRKGERELIDQLVGHVAVVLSVDPGSVSATAPFLELGLSSAQIVQLSAFLEDSRGVEVPATAGFDHPCIGALAGFVLEQEAGATP